MSRCPFFHALLSGLLLAFSAPLSAADSAEDVDLTLVVGHSPPQNVLRDGQPQGMAVDIVKLLVADAGLRVKYTDYPWARAYEQARNAADHCIFSLARFEEREALFQWIGPLAFNDWAFFALREKKLQIHRLDDARVLRVGGQRNDAKITWLQVRGFEIDFSKSEAQALRKLEMGRIDVYPANMLARPMIADALKRPLEDVVPVFTYKNVQNYMGCSRGTAAEKVAKLQAAFERRLKDGSIRKIWTAYGTDIPAAWR